MPKYPTSNYSKDCVFTFETEGGKYIIDATKLDIPLTLIYLALESDLDIHDAFYKLQVVVEDYIQKYDKQYEKPLSGTNMLALSGTVRQMMAIQQVLTACALFFNSLEYIEEKEE